MKSLLHVMLIFLLIFNSCKKEDERKAVTAGVYDATFNFNEFSPPLKINLLQDTVNHYSFGTDSIDLDLDGKFDLMISQRLTDKSVSRFDAQNYPFYSLQLKNGLEVATKRENYALAKGTLILSIGLILFITIPELTIFLHGQPLILPEQCGLLHLPHFGAAMAVGTI